MFDTPPFARRSPRGGSPSRSCCPNRQPDDALAEGAAGFDRVAELAKIDDADLHPHLDITGLRRMVGCRQSIARHRERREYSNRYLAVQPDLFSTTWKLHGVPPSLEGDLVRRVLDERADRLPVGPREREFLTSRRADARVDLCAGAGRGDQAGSTSAVTTTVIIEARDAAPSHGAAGAGVVSGPRVGPSTLDRLLCESTVEVTARAEDGTPLAFGDSATTIPPRIRRFVLERDGGICAADGCRSTSRLRPHHIEERANGGTHRPENLVTLCWYHHHVVVHGRGYRIDPASPAQRRRFLRPTGSDPP